MTPLGNNVCSVAFWLTYCRPGYPLLYSERPNLIRGNAREHLAATRLVSRNHIVFDSGASWLRRNLGNINLVRTSGNKLSVCVRPYVSSVSTCSNLSERPLVDQPLEGRLH